MSASSLKYTDENYQDLDNYTAGVKLLTTHESNSSKNRYMYVLQRYYPKPNSPRKNDSEILQMKNELFPDDLQTITSEFQDKEDLKKWLATRSFNDISSTLEYIYYVLWTEFGNIMFINDDIKVSVGISFMKGGKEADNSNKPFETAMRELKEESGKLKKDDLVIKLTKNNPKIISYGNKKKIMYEAKIPYDNVNTKLIQKIRYIQIPIKIGVVIDPAIINMELDHRNNYEVNNNPYTGLNWKKSKDFFDNRFEAVGYYFHEEDLDLNTNRKKNLNLRINLNIKKKIIEHLRTKKNLTSQEIDDLKKEISQKFKETLKFCLVKMVEYGDLPEPKTSNNNNSQSGGNTKKTNKIKSKKSSKSKKLGKRKSKSKKLSNRKTKSSNKKSRKL